MIIELRRWQTRFLSTFISYMHRHYDQFYELFKADRVSDHFTRLKIKENVCFLKKINVRVVFYAYHLGKRYDIKF